MEHKIYYDLETLKNALEIIKKAVERYPKSFGDSVIEISDALLQWFEPKEVYELANCVIHKELDFTQEDFDVPIEIVADFFLGIGKRSEKLSKRFPMLKQIKSIFSMGISSGTISTNSPKSDLAEQKK